jgi:hypothetical protein
MARPGLEPGTPRFSVVAAKLSNSAESPAVWRLLERHDHQRDLRKLRFFVADLGTRGGFGAQSDRSVADVPWRDERRNDPRPATTDAHQGRRRPNRPRASVNHALEGTGLPVVVPAVAGSNPVARAVELPANRHIGGSLGAVPLTRAEWGAPPIHLRARRREYPRETSRPSIAPR